MATFNGMMGKVEALDWTLGEQLGGVAGLDS